MDEMSANNGKTSLSLPARFLMQNENITYCGCLKVSALFSVLIAGSFKFNCFESLHQEAFCKQFYKNLFLSELTCTIFVVIRKLD
jgi:hypothetical protein